jgi:hypothetical protein
MAAAWMIATLGLLGTAGTGGELLSPAPTAITLAGALLLSSAFPLAHYFRRFTARIKHRWQALSAGVAVAYVFVNVIPELEVHRPIIAGSAMGVLLDAEKRVYLWALAGFVAFVGLSRLRYFTPSRALGASLVYRAEMAGYSLYTLLLGYLLVHREDDTLLSLELFVFAMGLHLFMLDNELAEQFEGGYEPRGRILLASFVLVGWVLGTADAFPDFLTSRLFAFVVGGVVITSAREELPVEEGGRLGWFVAGAAFYAILLMWI